MPLEVPLSPMRVATIFPNSVVMPVGAVTNLKEHADWPMIVHLDLRREGQLLLPK